MEYQNCTTKDGAAKAYAHENIGIHGTDQEYDSIQAKSFKDGAEWYENKILGLVNITPDAMMDRVQNAASELELLQLSTAIMLNAPKYTSDVCVALSKEIGLRSVHLIKQRI